MKILIISKYAVIPGHGSNPRWHHLARLMTRLGHSCTIVTSDSNHGSHFPALDQARKELSIDGVDYEILRTRKYQRTASVARVVSWFDFDFRLFRHRPARTFDVVVISSLSLTSILFGIHAKARHGSRLVFEIRDIWPLTMIEEGRFGRWHPLVIFLRWIELWGYRRADLIVGTMPNLSQHVAESGIRRQPATFHTCGIGVLPERAGEVEPFAFSPELEARLEDRTMVGYCGSIGLTNNLEDFVAYMEACDRTDVVFVIAGDGADRQRFEARLAGRENVFFIGRISPDDVQGFLRRSDILFLSTLPSRIWAYGQSMNKVVDYMLAGKYIVAQYIGYPSFINEAGCGVFTDAAGLAGCLDAAIDMPRDERVAAGLAGREWLLENQSYEELASQYLQKLSRLSEPTGRAVS